MRRKTKVRLIHLKKFLMYAFRWQCSTPIYAIIMYMLKDMNTVESTIIANAIGACIFYWIDKYIFTSNIKRSKRR